MTIQARGIPALINTASGTADAARTALAANHAFDVRESPPDKLESTLKGIVDEGVPRLLVSGGDGTIATAATVLAGTGTELAILPGGTLNHFATDLGLSTDAGEALACAENGTARDVDVGMVNGRVFLNTSSVGAYVHFVRVREYLEKRFGYRIASTLAALRTLVQLRKVAVEIEVDGKRRIYRTPIVFIGVGERELQLPTLGNRVAGGKRGLHVMIVSGRSRGRMLAIALNAVARGVKTAARTPELDSFIVDRCTITLRHRTLVALDGELVPLDTPLEYSLNRDSLRVICP
ncbi:MAG: diacylglycerol kinase catalytic region [Gemmatimonadetes bacterium]|nr:diacylglycerol kinase catalytic region [Gemmatimonadota bacterium]